jgi:putative phosphoribosyl transferase
VQAKKLPARANLEHYKKQAKDLLNRVVSGEPEAIHRIRRVHPRLGSLAEPEIRDGSKLADAHLVIAREHGHESWPAFTREIHAAGKPTTSSERIPANGVDLPAESSMPSEAAGLVLLLHTRSGGRLTPASGYLMESLNRTSLGVISVDLLTPEESVQDVETDEMKHDLRLLGRRISKIADWLNGRGEFAGLSLGYMGSDTGAAAAAYSAAEYPEAVQSLVFSSGRPDLAGPWLWKIKAPTLFLVGERATVGRAFSHSAMRALSPQVTSQFEIISGAGESFKDDGALKQCARLSCDWFRRHLAAQST